MTERTHTELAELVSLHALDALDDDNDRADVEAHLDTCATCPVEYAEMRESMGLLGGLSSVTPSATLRRSVLAAVDETPQVASPSAEMEQQGATGTNDRTLRAVPDIPVDEGPGHPEDPIDLTSPRNGDDATRRPLGAPTRLASNGRASRLFRSLVGAAAAAVLVVGAVVAINSRGDSLTRAEEVAAIEGSRTVDLAASGVAEGAEVSFVFANSTGEGVLVASELDPVPADRTYEFWLIDAEGAHPAGLFRPDEDGNVELTVDGVDPSTLMVGITIEPAEGSDAPTGDVIYAAELA